MRRYVCGSGPGRLTLLLSILGAFPLSFEGGIAPSFAQGTGLQEQWNDQRQGYAAYERGLLAQSRGDDAEMRIAFDAADQRFRRILGQNPQRADLYAPLADMLIRRGQAAAAYVLLSKEIQKGSEDPKLHFQLARALHGIHQTRRSLDIAKKASSLSPESLEILSFLAERAAELGESQTVVSSLSKILSKYPKDVTLTHRRLYALALANVGRMDESLQLLEELARDNPKDNEIRKGLALVLAKRGREEDRVRAVKMLLQIHWETTKDKKDPALALSLAKTLLDLGRATEAQTILKELGSEHPEALALLGRTYLWKRPSAPELARPVLERAFQSLGKDQGVCLDLALSLAALGQKDRALVQTRLCTTIQPGQPGPGTSPHLLLSILQLEAGKVDEALPSLTQLFAETQEPSFVEPPLPVAYEGILAPLASTLESTVPRSLKGALRLTLGLAHLRKGAATLGLVDLRRAHELVPSPKTATLRALAHLQAGAPKEALSVLRPYCESPVELQAQLSCSRVFREAGQPEAAHKVLLAAQKAALSTSAKGQKHPLGSVLRMELAQTLLSLDRPKEAIESLQLGDGDEEILLCHAHLRAARKALETKPETASPWLHFQALSKLRGRLTQAQRAEVDLLTLLAQIRGGQTEVAQKRIVQLAEEYPQAIWQSLLGPSGLDDLKARLALRQGLIGQALPLSQKAILGLSPKEADHLQGAVLATVLSKAHAAYERGDYERAYTLLKTPALQSGLRAPHAAILQYNLGALALSRGKKEEALALLAKVDAKEVPEKWVALGALHEQEGDRKTALEEYQRYLQATGTGPIADQVRRWVELLGKLEPQGAALSEEATTKEGLPHAARRGGKLR